MATLVFISMMVNLDGTVIVTAFIQSPLTELQSGITNLDFHENNNFAALDRVFQLPLVYGATLVEATRRSKGAERMRVEVDVFSEDLFQETEQEQGRRKKWTASHSDFSNEDMNTKDALIDLKATDSRNSWAFVSRDEIFTWVDNLRALGINDTVQSVIQRRKALDAPVRKQKTKPFKNGSIHNLSQRAALRGGDEVRCLQDEKERRVWKLEDLLRRQSQLSRPASGTFQHMVCVSDLESWMASYHPPWDRRKGHVFMKTMTRSHIFLPGRASRSPKGKRKALNLGHLLKWKKDEDGTFFCRGDFHSTWNRRYVVDRTQGLIIVLEI
ncbi:hypothetical protein AYL99_11631 [Fonsecaea erecta]|uniref:Uncharacterized protein n=1 Tax=Fonsecaea erecta TaxID=1367422 RepID=A0A178Z3N8_9EURO|nr:hypothetical protein AYL99_11631 [Fonsecaea erecta]OAP54096.1 hypothetical protein AYL99_11631 [Fonsecaea erecta]